MRAALFLFWVLAQPPHQHHPPRSAGEYAHVLEHPGRDKWQKPDQVLEALALRPGEIVADIGAGTGYFARRFARHAAKVYAVDIDPKLLEIAKRDAPANLETILAAPDDPKLPEASVDTIFFADVWHHLDNRPGYAAKLARALKPGGRVVMIDFHKKPLPVGPPERMKLTEQQVIEELEPAGFRLEAKHDFLPYQYFLVFRVNPR
jgi:ubiquinone/menaquinone biosynthesis C-methylase UbiE